MIAAAAEDVHNKPTAYVIAALMLLVERCCGYLVGVLSLFTESWACKLLALPYLFVRTVLMPYSAQLFAEQARFCCCRR
jgi:hypothetical protein